MNHSIKFPHSMLYYAVVALTTGILSACQQGGFSGNPNKGEKVKPIERPQVLPQQPAQPPVVLPPPVVQPPVVLPPPVVQPPVVPNVPLPTVDPRKPQLDNDTFIPDQNNRDNVIPHPTTQPVLPPSLPLPTVAPYPQPNWDLSCDPFGPSGNAGKLMVTVTPFSNMETGHQATNPGFWALLHSNAGQLIAAGPMTMRAVVNGSKSDASRGSAYGRLTLAIDLQHLSQQASGQGQGSLSICMAENPSVAATQITCKKLGGSLDNRGEGGRPFQWIDKGVDYQIDGQNVRVTRFHGSTGEGGSSDQLALSLFHPAFGMAAPASAFKDYQSPLVLDLNANHEPDLTNVWDQDHAVYFDLAANSIPVRTGWVKPGDGLLALDVNGDGLINSGSELFGEYAHSQLMGVGLSTKRFEDGFSALAAYDDNKDSKIDANDKIFSKLLVWQDLNQDGKSQPEEIKSLAYHKIKSISLRAVKVNEQVIASSYDKHEGNEVRLTSSFTLESGAVRPIVDVWFKQRRYEGVSYTAEVGHE